MVGDARDAFANSRRLAKVTRSISTPILDASGNLISVKTHKMKRWRDHYADILNPPSAPCSEELMTAAQSATEDPDIDYNEPTVQEIIKCLNKMKNDKAPSICNITPEMMKAGGPDCINWLTKII